MVKRGGRQGLGRFLSLAQRSESPEGFRSVFFVLRAACATGLYDADPTACCVPAHFSEGRNLLPN
jgi:hypothetical protein